jgi:hypothetical protein
LGLGQKGGRQVLVRAFMPLGGKDQSRNNFRGTT